MGFTNELKNRVEWELGPNDYSKFDRPFTISSQSMILLLRRLEAGEKIIKWACSAPQVFRNKEFIDLIKIWLKEGGQS